MMINASDMGEERTINDKTRIYLRKHEAEKIENAFIKNEIIEKFSAKISFEEIIEQKYNISPQRYFKLPSDNNITTKQFNTTMENLSIELNKLFNELSNLEKEIKNILNIIL